MRKPNIPVFDELVVANPARVARSSSLPTSLHDLAYRAGHCCALTREESAMPHQQAQTGLHDVGAMVTYVRERLVTALLDDVKARYDLGQVVHKLRYPAAGDSCPTVTLAALARMSGHGPRALRRYARVAEIINAEELADYLELRTPRGMPLSWSHLEELMRVHSRTRRREFAATAAGENLSARALRPLVKHNASERQ
jgi:hypothetical protein